MTIKSDFDPSAFASTCQISAFNLASLFHDVEQIRRTRPLIHNITNWVTMQTTANILLALGAAPIMAHAKEELDAIIQSARALVINIGTLDAYWLSCIKQGQQAALKRGIPIVFDPVGVGASHYRNTAALTLVEHGVDIIRGNASEIMALQDTTSKTKGVDTLQTSEQAISSASVLAKKYHCIVVISGKIDFIVSASRTVALPYGSALLTKIAGMGCSLTAIIASFLSVNPDRFKACVHATAFMGLLSEYAEIKSNGPASFYMHLLDGFYSLQRKDVQDLYKMDVTYDD